MQTTQDFDILGVDGGGTACRMAAIVQGHRFEIRTGSANVSSDFEAAIATLDQGLQALADQAGLPIADLRALPAHLGLAGVMDQSIGQRVATALSLKHAQIHDDRAAALCGALGGKSGAIAGIGTGSFLARQSETGVQFVGGYGLSLGDEASGAWLGRALLRRCLHVLDGLAPTSPVVAETLAQFDHTAAQIVAFAGRATPADYGQFAPAITGAARQQDPFARDLMAQGAHYITNGLTAMGWAIDEPLCLTGGVGSHYAPYLPDALRARLMTAIGTNLDGALTLAAQQAQA